MLNLIGRTFTIAASEDSLEIVGHNLKDGKFQSVSVRIGKTYELDGIREVASAGSVIAENQNFDSIPVVR